MGRATRHDLRLSKRPPRPRRGMAAVVMVVLMLLLGMIVAGLVIGGGREHDLTVRRLDTVQAFYAAEAGMNMALREVMVGRDEDGDGVIGAISDDGNDANNPTLRGADIRVSRSDTFLTASLVANTGRGLARRVVDGSLDLDFRFEHGAVTVGSAPVAVDFRQSYTSPVVVCSAAYAANVTPIVVRVDAVTSTGCNLWLQSPGDALTPLPESVWFLVMEAGAWTVSGSKFEARRYSSTVTDENNSWVGQSQSYIHTYTSPVVIGQVMSANDPKWSVFWCRGPSRSDPPNVTTLFTGKHVGEDPDTTRSSETVGYIVFEAGHGVIGRNAFDARVSTDTIRGVGNGPPYLSSFLSPFTDQPPLIAFTSAAGMDGVNGGWPIVYGATPTTLFTIDLAYDEDQVNDPERSHTPEQASVVVFERPRPGPEVVTWVETQP